MVLFPPPFYFVFENSKLLLYIQSNELAHHVMGTIFLVNTYWWNSIMCTLSLIEILLRCRALYPTRQWRPATFHWLIIILSASEVSHYLGCSMINRVINRVIYIYSRTSELRNPPPPGNEGVYNSEMSVTLKSSTSLKILCVVLFNFHEEYAAMISIEHKLANTEARAL